MATALNQFYYVDQGRPILKTEYDDGSEDFYDASGQFPGTSWSHMGDGTVIDPYADSATQSAERQAAAPQFQFGPTGTTVSGNEGYSIGGSGSYADPAGGQAVPNPLSAPGSKPPVRDDYATNPSAQGGYASGKNEAQTATAQAGNPQNMDRYDWAGNPRQAMLNAMADMGGFQMTNNPYVDRLLSAAPGLATSFMADKGLGGANQDDVANSYGNFATFLRQVLGSGNVFGTLSRTGSQMGDITNAVRGYNQAGMSGGDANDPRLQNPFIRQLAAMFGANNNQGALQVQGQLQSPFMTQRQQAPFADAMETRYTQGARGFYEGGDPNRPGSGGNDWWKYLFGY